jgi:hypothetical protein
MTDVLCGLLDDVPASSDNDDSSSIRCERLGDGYCQLTPRVPSAEQHESHIFQYLSLRPSQAQSDLSDPRSRDQERTVPETVNRFSNLNRSRPAMSMTLLRPEAQDLLR